jgi:FkbM family methyltransferase
MSDLILENPRETEKLTRHGGATLPVFRSGTIDQYVWDSVAVRNEYLLPDRFLSVDVIVDIGAHIGSFSYVALSRGAGHVYSYEADVNNCRIARMHLSDFGSRVTLEHRAVCRSDSPPSYLKFSGYRQFRDGVVNTGGGDVLSAEEGTKVATIPFDELVLHATENGRHRIRMVKLDCEGSEYPILFTSKQLDLIDEIVAEFHEMGIALNTRDAPVSAPVNDEQAWCGEVLGDHLKRHGFAVRIGCRLGNLGKLFAWNKRSLTTVFGR